MNAFALIIGNDDYQNPDHKLHNAVNDADAITDKLFELGFVVKKETNCDLETFMRSVIEFGEELKKFDVGLFYFSGHGLQIDGLNYLTAIDTPFSDTISARRYSYCLDDVIEYMQKALSTINILILDACRNNPLPNSFKGVQEHGLAPIHAPKGTIIAFSTSPGQKARDYGVGKNGIYTESLLNHIDDINIPIEEFFKRVRTSVYDLSGGTQTSWEHTSLIGNFCFKSGKLVHSIDLPYNNDVIADELFVSTGSAIDDIIIGLKVYTWRDQASAIKKITLLNPKPTNINELFLLGRNILQTACGGEYNAIRIMNNLESWLTEYRTGSDNHILNGILFEIYFNKKGNFRLDDFKSEFIDQILKLQSNRTFRNSIVFINKQLTPFSNYLLYIPNPEPKALALEMIIETKEVIWEEKTINYNTVISIKHEGKELLPPLTDGDFEFMLRYDELINKISKQLAVPKNQLRISTNIVVTDNPKIRIAYYFDLRKRKKKQLI